ncbi:MULTISPECIES: hypothetical protein [Nocardiaceae]|uniref:Excreted virulence factor EspC, type VII ESX diderm n=1 Tax=Rhodococcoides kroppenstedtii TaxID=293050 RepID=A0ABS7NPJ9_9NOCA|nr:MULTISPECIES: hypothetical protein [Rhodococcus]AMY18026.1 hypothetical protein A3Q40_00618 [Rhodococcus sp. PBTS 1]MBY6313638.1 hypothetical protein [Rhodococcus kroppenstedtii]MBY6319939.1 hypothetical protein [Rhodococcus kroppenstedtii]MBY6398878.1 hypothetical protein [Rhodococcus kroppenstedtii]MBY6435729.1 hypothetical protein [Rhodococcus kroppenstedtii]
MLVDADIEAMKFVSRTVLVEAERLAAVPAARAAVAMPGAATAAAMARANRRLSSAIKELAAGVTATARSVAASAVGYNVVDSANAARLGGVTNGGL